MNQIIEFFKKLFDSTDWPPRWHCGRWTEFHGWLYIISDLLIWSAYFTIPIVIIRYISKKQDIKFTRLYFLFAAFILACGATHFLDAIAFWIPAYRLNALVRLITGVLSWMTVFYLVQLLPAAFSLKSQKELETEIDQRKKAEQQSRESEEQVQTIFNAAPDAVIVIDHDGLIIKWNSKSEILFGWKAEEVMNKPLSETIIPSRYREAHTAGLKHFLETGEGPVLGKAIEIHALNKNNIEFDVSLSISPTLVNGKYLFIGFVRDITEKKRAEAQIQKQKQDIQDFIDSMSTLSAKLSTEGKVLMVNKIALQASGLSIEELLNTNFLEGQWWTFDPEVHSRVQDAFKKACSGIVINYDENIFVFGQVLTINLSLIPILKTDDSVDYIVAEGRDITAQKKAEEKIKESEEKYSILFNSMDEGFCIIEMIFDEQERPVDYRFLVINPSFEKQTGLRDAVGKRMREFAPNHEQHWFEIYGRIALTGESIRFENRAEQLHRWYDVYAFRFGEPKNLQVAILFNDITERKQTEETIRDLNLRLEKRVEEKTKEVIQNEKRFRNLIENSTDIISLANENFKTVYRSPSAERITGWTSEEREKAGYLEQTHPDDKETMKVILKNILANPGKPVSVIYRTRHKDGHYLWLEGIMTNMLHDESIKAIVANLRDITENKKAQDLLYESQQLLSAIVENSTAVIYVKNLQGQYLMVNRRFSELFHLSMESIPGKTDYDFFSKEQADAFRRMDVRVATANYALTEEEVALHDDGVHTYISVKSTLRDDKGNPYAIFGISTDITERKKVEEAILHAEANYREIFENATDAIYVHEIDTGKVIEVNQRAVELTGYTKEELLNTDPNDFITGHPDYTLEKALGYIQKAAIGKQQLFEWLSKKKDGSLNWFEVNLKKANITGQERILAFFREINDRKKAQLEVQKLNEGLEQKVMERTTQLETVNKELEAFSYSVSHDLRAPLRIIDGYTEIIVSDYGNKLDEEGNRLLGIVTGNVRRMGHLIDDLLNLSRQGRKELNFRHINMVELVELVIAEQDILKTNQSIMQVGRLEPAYCDSSLIRQVWVNLISNAIKYSGTRDNPKIEINSVISNNEIIYSIKDNGVGFNMQYADKLFGVFQRLHKMTEFEGTGVGLALVHRIVTRHGGRVWAEAEENKGATFYFSLPINTNTHQNN